MGNAPKSYIQCRAKPGGEISAGCAGDIKNSLLSMPAVRAQMQRKPHRLRSGQERREGVCELFSLAVRPGAVGGRKLPITDPVWEEL